MFEEVAPAQAPVAPAATETTLDGEDDDASGPSILHRAAAEMIVDEAERNRHIDAAEALLGLIPASWALAAKERSLPMRSVLAALCPSLASHHQTLAHHQAGRCRGLARGVPGM